MFSPEPEVRRRYRVLARWRGQMMLGHHWEPAEGTIVDRRITRYVPVGPGNNELPLHEFVVDVRQADGQAFRVTIEEKAGKIVPPDVGAVVKVEVDPKSRKVRFDENDPQLNVRAVVQGQRQAEQDRFATELKQPPTTT
jgi:hypothetical protein